MQQRVKVFAASLGFLTVSYDQFCITHVLLMLKHQYNITTNMASAIASSALAASIVGMLVFGFFATHSSHARMVAFLVTMSLVTFGAFASAWFSWGSALSVTIVISCFRSIMGLGIGGEYPLTSNIACDSGGSSTDSSLVFAFQGIGNLLAALMTLFFVSVVRFEYAFRLVLSFGGIIGLVALPVRYYVYKSEVKIDVNTPSLSTMVNHAKVHWVALLGCSGTWFLFDVCFYGNALFMDTILSFMHVSTSDPVEEVFDKAKLATYICLGALPGYYLAVLTLRKFGLCTLQLLGFTMLFFVFGVMALLYTQLAQAPVAFVILYGMTFLFSNWGPNSTTFVLPVAVFPEDFRTFAHGFSAACGKLGAVVGAVAINTITSQYGVRYAVLTSACVAFLGGTLTYICFLFPTRKPDYIPLN